MKEYLLLRKNVQSGPYDLNELVSLNLRSADLIWIEGKSFSWRYPSEISELSSYVQEVDAPVMVVTPGGMDIPETQPRQEVKHKTIVAIKPSAGNHSLSVKTVAPRTNVLKVQVREKEPEPAEEHDILAIKESIISKTAPSSQSPDLVMAPARVTQTDNKIEFFVLAVGAISLLAVLYLLFTTSY
ncbi:MAG: hypothetical protein KIT80_11180 [Chitinophagaceae bacterium]|nr:hypothetical protein [Chitinophagaceae bacterium]MCW5927465.1 hypothetical protein [Chitinophagaceae bacterium]